MLRLTKVEYNKFDQYLHVQNDKCRIRFCDIKINQEKELELAISWTCNAMNIVNIEVPNIATFEVDLDAGKTTLSYDHDRDIEVEIEALPGGEVKITTCGFSVVIVTTKCETKATIEIYEYKDNRYVPLTRLTYDVD